MNKHFYASIGILLIAVIFFQGCEDKSSDPAAGPYGLIGSQWAGDTFGGGGGSDYYIDEVLELSLKTNGGYDYIFKLFEVSNTFKYKVSGTYTVEDNSVSFTENTLYKFDIYDDIFVEIQSIPGDGLHLIDNAVYEDSTLTIYRDGNAVARLSELTDS